MLDAFANFYNDDYRARTDELGVTTRQLLVIASMIEKETSIDRERAAISGVIHNRINLELEEEYNEWLHELEEPAEAETEGDETAETDTEGEDQ